MLELDNLILTGAGKLAVGSGSGLTGKQTQQGEDSPFLALLNVSQEPEHADVNSTMVSGNQNNEQVLELVNHSGTSAKQPHDLTSKHTDLISKLQNDLTLLFSDSNNNAPLYIAADTVDTLTQAQQEQHSSIVSDTVMQSPLMLVVPTQVNSSSASTIEVKVTVTWGKVAKGYLSQLKTSEAGVQSLQLKHHLNTSSGSGQATPLPSNLGFESTKLNNSVKLQSQLWQVAGTEQVSNRVYEQVKKRAVLEGAKPHYDSRSQAYSAQALFIVPTNDKELKVSARDYFNRQDYSKSVLSWLDSFVSKEMLSKLSEYSFNGVTLWQREE
ncbi:hypothetical protein [Pseudoalteromonas byunsanensis]|uniref:Uncharacterized protein n=1 Tax=Pseudoalteromonas byunsanensis TaxID=327939 RepID=A0A1S1N7S3_9GAMM|nr:hypothetical protein [Pseudoalteromonas byunsanensis]OHU97342.1 hypothetical protein BIW53_03200 [Pseudoalteromonas byunsanensis]